jgi:hypothetical protein
MLYKKLTTSTIKILEEEGESILFATAMQLITRILFASTTTELSKTKKKLLNKPAAARAKQMNSQSPAGRFHRIAVAPSPLLFLCPNPRIVVGCRRI